MNEARRRSLRGLYPIADFDACRKAALDPVEVARAMGGSGVNMLQLRGKSLTDGGFLRWVQTTVSNVPSSVDVIINDRADLALLGGAHGVHVGQDDLPVPAVRACSARLVVGLSTHTQDQLAGAIADRPDYLAFGPVFSTSSKKDPEPSTGMSALAAAHSMAKSAGIPLVAIGGIDDVSLSSVGAHCDLIAAISVLLPKTKRVRPYSWISDRCSQLHETIIQDRAW